MNPVVVVGSGASGVHFALTALEQGRRVVMLDVGYTAGARVNPRDTFIELKRNLPDPAEYLLGNDYQSMVLPGHDGEYYAFPPGKEHVFRNAPGFRYRADGFTPLNSFAAGGLAEAWTGGSYPFNDRDLTPFPFGYSELAPHYASVARRIGVTGVADDLAEVFPFHDGLSEPLSLDEHSATLLDSYSRRRTKFKGDLLGRARVAVLSKDAGNRKACRYCGRCLWGCPTRSFYTPSITLDECRTFPRFEYVPGVYVDHFKADSGGRIHTVLARTSTGALQEFPVDSLVLAAGTLGSSKIFLESMYRESGKAPELHGLMDNRQVLMPFVNLRMLGRKWNPDSYQYHQLAIAIKSGGEFIHGLITTLKTALIHPLVQNLPFDLATSLEAFRHIHAALGMININFPDSRRPENVVSLDTSSAPHKLVIRYSPEADEVPKLRETIRRFRKFLWNLGCFAPRSMTHVRPKGASVHYSGTIPMSSVAAPLTCSRDCRSHDFENLYFADGTSFPYLPAKNLTFTLMANATRVANVGFEALDENFRLSRSIRSRSASAL